MIGFTKSEKRAAKDLIRKGILHRHVQWQQELRELLNKPYGEDGNEFDRSLEITAKARNFYKEAMMMEDYYSTNNLVSGLACLYRDNHLSTEDIDSLPENVAMAIQRILDI